MSLVLQPETVESLRNFVDEHVRHDGCDHSRRFTCLWAAANHIDLGELEDILDDHGWFCDCEVVLNLPVDMAIQVTLRPKDSTPDNPWLLPPDYNVGSDTGFTHVLVGTDQLKGNNHHNEGEWVIPAPFGLKPQKRIRKLVHYFIGLDSGMPAEVAYVAEADPISAADFHARVVASIVDGIGAFSPTDAAFILSRLATMKPGISVGVSFVDKLTDRGKHQELRIHRVLVRR